MLDARGFRQLLIADLAVVRGVAGAADVAAAFQQFWNRRTSGEVSVSAELIRIADLEGNALDPVEVEADRLIDEAGGDAWIALTRRGGLDPSIHVELGRRDGEVSVALTKIGAGARAPLRTVTMDRYQEFEVAGEGGMGVVYVALDTEMNRQVALKMVRPDVGSVAPHLPPEAPIDATRTEHDPRSSQAFNELKARFLQEAWITGGLEHPGIVPVHELGQTPHGIPYYTMRLVRGKHSLQDAIEDVQDAPMEDRLALLEPFLKLCDTVRYAHARGVLHRDLKPANVAIGEFGEVVLLDWGLAKLAGQAEFAAHRWQERVRELRAACDLETMVGAIGTPGFMSPEAALGRLDELDEQSDVYSLGVILYLILTGRQPYAFETYGEYVGLVSREDPAEAQIVALDVPKGLSDLCAHCLSRAKTRRPASVDELARSIRAWQTASAIDREVDGLMRDARAALDSADTSRGDARLQQVDRAAVALARVAKRRPDDEAADVLRHRAEELRERGLAEREKAAGRRLLLRLGIAALVLVAVSGFVVTALINEEREAKAQAAENAEQRLLESLEENGRMLLIAGHPLRAAPYLAAAYEAGKQDDVLRLLLCEACRPMDAQISTFGRHEGKPTIIYTIASSPDGGLLASGSAERPARLWDLDSGALRRTLEGHTESVRSVAFSPDGATVATASSDRSARLWDVRTGRQLASFTGHEHTVASIAFSPDGQEVLTGSYDGSVRLWDATTGREARMLARRPYRLLVAAFSPDGETVATAGVNDTVWLWRTDAGPEQEGRALRGHDNSVRAAAFHPDGSILATGSADRTVKCWDVATGSEIRTLAGHTDAVVAVAFSRDGRTLATGGRDLTARLWEVETGRALGALHGHTGTVGAVAWDAHGTRLLTAGGDTSIRVWDPSLGRRVVKLEGHAGLVQRAAFSPDGTTIATASRDGTAKLWDTATRRELRTLVGHAGAVRAAVFSPDGAQVATSGVDGTARLWEVATGREISALEGHTDEVRWTAFDPHGTTVATASRDGTVRLWDTGTGRELRRIDCYVRALRRGAFSAAFSPDGRTLAVSGLDYQAKVFDVATGREVQRLEGHMAGIASIRFSPDGTRLLTASKDRMAKLWDVETGREVATLEGHTFTLWSAEFSPEGSEIVTTSYDGTVKLWDVGTGRELTTITGHEYCDSMDWDYALSAVFSPDGRYVLATAADDTVKLCRVQREARSAAEIAELLRERCPYALVEGRLVKAKFQRFE